MSIINLDTQLLSPLGNMVKDFNNYFQQTSQIIPWNNETDYYLDILAPGFKTSDIDINLDNNILNISGNIIVHRNNPQKYTIEYRYNVPNNADLKKIDAKLENGILRIKINKILEYNFRKIEILE